MVRRGPLVAGIVAAAAVTLVLLRPWAPEERLPVLVRVVDTDGNPVPAAEVQATYAPGWRKVGADGTLRLPKVPLREGEVETPETVSWAIDARAAFHVVRSRSADGDRATGDYEVELVLERHGVLRVHVPLTRFTNAEARVVHPVGTRALDGIEVARPERPAAYRIPVGADRVVVDLKGDEGMAWKRLVLDPPSPGSLREISMIPEAAAPISGRVVPPDPAPPTLFGVLDVEEIFPDRDPVPRESVVIGDDGRFVVPYVAPGRFRLSARCPFAEVPSPVVATAGTSVELPSTSSPPWLSLSFPSFPDGRRPYLTIRDETARDSAPVTPAARWFQGRLLVRLPPGPVALVVDVAGSDDHPPLAGRLETVVPDAGGATAEVALAATPFGTVVVRPDPYTNPAKVTLYPGGRTLSLLPGLGDLTFPHASAGPGRLVFDRGPRRETVLPIDVRAGETLVVEVPTD